MKKFLFALAFLCFSVLTFAHPSDKVKWTIALSDRFYGGVATDLAPITLHDFSAIDSIWLESLVAFKMFDVEKKPLFVGLGVHCNLKPTDTGFRGGFSLGLSWTQETEKIKPYAAFSIIF